MPFGSTDLRDRATTRACHVADNHASRRNGTCQFFKKANFEKRNYEKAYFKNVGFSRRFCRWAKRRNRLAAEPSQYLYPSLISQELQYGAVLVFLRIFVIHLIT